MSVWANVWVNKYVNVWVCDCVIVWVCECGNGPMQVSEYVIVWMIEGLSTSVCEWMIVSVLSVLVCESVSVWVD